MLPKSVLVILSLTTSCTFANSLKPNISLDSVSPNAETNGVQLQWPGLKGVGGMSMPLAIGTPTECADPGPSDLVCMEWNDYGKIAIVGGNDRCVRVESVSQYARQLEDCFDIEDGVHWYGGGEMYRQHFPIESEKRPEVAFVTADSIALPDLSFGGITENYWLLSSGVSIHVDEDVPLFFSLNTTQANRVCFVAKDQYPYTKRTQLSLKYSICFGDDIKSVRESDFQRFYGVPSTIPDEAMLLKPFWSTWAQYKEDINQSLAIDYAKKIQENGFSWSSHIEIDDDWETCYGEQEFNLEKFPDPKAMVQELKDMGFRVTLWVHPFINQDCPSFTRAVNWGYFVRDPKLQPQITYWWKGLHSGIVDMTNIAAVAWWKSRLQKLINDYGIDSFKFDAGETNWLPYANTLYGNASLQPNLYSTKYAEVATSYGNLVEVRAARRNQDKAMFVRMLDKDSRWGYDNGLKSLIPTLLHFGIVGYPYVLPDMIGGNAYLGETADKELFIRWMQANVFMPSVQFSIAPWDYDQQTVDITLEVIGLREKYQDKLLTAARQAASDGTPINRPVFWADPTDPETFTIDSQYLLGDDILVAPVLDQGATSRNIYLPKGNWQDSVDSLVVHTGPVWLTDYPAPINVVPFFVKMAST